MMILFYKIMTCRNDEIVLVDICHRLCIPVRFLPAFAVATAWQAGDYVLGSSQNMSE